jgi:pimeloyl-ACP methyl ester carboxylesterase
MVNGLFGSRANWRAIRGVLDAHLDASTTLLHVSSASEYAATYEGIDVCGRRLAEEVRGLAAAVPSLRRVSFLGHSMGGLVARWAAGALFDPGAATLAGLSPAHFVSMATPHLGCQTVVGPAQVPLLAWSARLPGVGSIMKALAPPFSAVAFGRTGRQLFLMDGQPGASAPLIHRLSTNQPDEGLHFLSSLRAFETRTAYANSSGDHLVAWANSSLREVEELPQLRGRGRGVVREDPIEAAWRAPGAPAAPVSTAGGGDHAAATVRASLRALQALPWRRVDVCFGASALPLLAHQHLQVQRAWVNGAGLATAEHLGRQLAAMEGRRGGAAGPGEAVV